MPSTATITSFYTFTANTKARASQVNANFDVFRGHILPISPNTQTAITNTYDLGSTEYRWNNVYSKEINITGATATSHISIIRDTATTTTEAIVKFGTSEVFRINQYGAKKNTLSETTTASVYQNAISGNIFEAKQTTGSTAFANSTLTISTLGNPIELKLISSTVTTAHVSAQGLTVASSYISIIANGLTAATFWLRSDLDAQVHNVYYPCGAISTILFYSAGTYTFYLTGKNDVTGGFYAINNCRLYAREL